jgi:hypothetical protein
MPRPQPKPEPTVDADATRAALADALAAGKRLRLPMAGGRPLTITKMSADGTLTLAGAGMAIQLDFDKLSRRNLTTLAESLGLK